ncbi:MAG TPA: hypothetical protein VGM30_14945 [Puia sp.]|jgi:hypothetical protein
MDNKFNFGQLKQAITRMKQDLPRQLANQAQNYFTDAFGKQGFDGQPWQDVKRHDTNTPEFKYPIGLQARKLSSPILVGVYRARSGGTLRRAVSRSIRSATWKSIKLQVDLPYAKAQFRGTDKIPARPNLQQSKELTAMQKETIRKAMDDAFKGNQ